MDQDVDKRAGFLGGIIPSYFVVGLVVSVFKLYGKTI